MWYDMYVNVQPWKGGILVKAEYINAFIKASTEVLNNFVTEKFSVGKPYIRSNPFPTKEFIIMLGITGDIKGQEIGRAHVWTPVTV